MTMKCNWFASLLFVALVGFASASPTNVFEGREILETRNGHHDHGQHEHGYPSHDYSHYYHPHHHKHHDHHKRGAFDPHRENHPTGAKLAPLPHYKPFPQHVQREKRGDGEYHDGHRDAFEHGEHHEHHDQPYHDGHRHHHDKHGHSEHYYKHHAEKHHKDAPHGDHHYEGHHQE